MVDRRRHRMQVVEGLIDESTAEPAPILFSEDSGTDQTPPMARPTEPTSHEGYPSPYHLR